MSIPQFIIFKNVILQIQELAILILSKEVYPVSELSKRLRSARERKGLKQIQVYERTGINNKTLSGYENGVSEPDTDTLKKLSEIYEVSIDWLTNNKKESYSLPESSIDNIIRETELLYKVNLHDDPVVLAAMKNLIESIAQAKSKQ